MKSIADPLELDSLVRRLGALRPETQRRFGTLTAGEMLCHLADSARSVLARPGAGDGRPRRLARWIGLYSSLPWPKGAKTAPGVDPRIAGTRPTDFEQDRLRAIEGLRQLSTAPAEAFPRSHAVFGRMRHQDWRCWAYRHTDHHLRQFGA